MNVRNHRKIAVSKREKFLEKEEKTFKRIEIDHKAQTFQRYEIIKDYDKEQRQKEKDLMELIQRKKRKCFEEE